MCGLKNEPDLRKPRTLTHNGCLTVSKNRLIKPLTMARKPPIPLNLKSKGVRAGIAGDAARGVYALRPAPLGTAPAPSVIDILRGSEYAISIFTRDELNEIELFSKNGKPYLSCAASDKARPARPEEIVRQLYVRRLIKHYGYPRERLALEKPVYFGAAVHEKAADIVVWEKDAPNTPLIIVEVKKPKRKDGLEQLKSYCNAEGSPIGVWTNGGETIVLHREDPNIFRSLPDLPHAGQTLADLLAERWTLEDLEKNNKLVIERRSLRGVIQDMEDLVLANAGVDAFDEVFKLVYAKLYDEWNAARGGKKRYLEFRVGGATPSEFAEKVDRLFKKAMEEWPGVFIDGERINLEPDHLKVCGSFLEDIKLFNSNLQVIDEAFEYLSVKAAKGEKGQYFTPRHVIDMCVKMLNPTIDEYVVDTAAGSCGFTVHAIFHVWGDVFSARGPNRWQSEYAATHVYGIDFDPRSVKIARALNLIAGDGRTNIYRANTLYPRMWNEEVRVGLKSRLRRFPKDAERDSWNREHFRHFDFDVLLTNPPFAGDIKDSRIIHQYDIAKGPKGKWENSVGRDILFVERNLEFLKPGGRAAVVLPQGRFNNASEEHIRRWIAERARVLAVVGLHPNTFRPHTGTKTSVLFLQTWNEDKSSSNYNPRKSDYPVFFATSQKSGKDNSGDYVYRIGPDNAPLLDDHGHMIVEHDLDEIAESFQRWGKKIGLRFS
jgi:type I restriction enzyme M protein